MKVEVLGINETIRFLGTSVTDKVSQVASIYLEEAQKATPIKSGRARRNWTKQVNRQDFDVSNNVPYIGRLEEGYSKQAPKGITRVASRRAKRRVQGI